MYQIDVWICNFMVTYVWVSQPSHLPGITEFHCFKCPHVSLPMCHSNVSPWVPLCQTKTCLGDPAESPPWHDRVPLLQVSPCVTPHVSPWVTPLVSNQNMSGWPSIALSCFRISWCFKLIAYSNDNISTHACFECEPPFIKYLITLITRKVLSK